MKRREFLAAGVASGVLLRKLHATTRVFSAGIQLYSIRGPLKSAAPAALKPLHSIGFREVETFVETGFTPSQMRSMVNDAGLRMPSAHLAFTMTNDLGPVFASAAEFQVEWAVSSFLRHLTDPGRTNTPNLKQPALPPMGRDGFQKMAARMNEIGRRAKTEGFKYAYHNHNFEFERLPDGEAGYDMLLRETDPDLVKFEVDCGWMVVAGSNPVDYFHRYPGRFRMLHIKDFQPTRPTIDMVGPDRPKGTELGTGFIDYAPIFHAAQSAGIQHVFAEQEEPYSRSQLESAKVSYNYLERFL